MMAGTLDRRVSILRATRARNEHGELVETWAPVVTVWAQRLDVTGREFFSATQTVAEGSARFRLRYRDDLLPTDRLEDAGRQFDIKHIAEIGRREATEVVAVARVL